jgi:hypothetical protein
MTDQKPTVSSIFLAGKELWLQNQYLAIIGLNVTVPWKHQKKGLFSVRGAANLGTPATIIDRPAPHFISVLNQVQNAGTICVYSMWATKVPF